MSNAVTNFKPDNNIMLKQVDDTYKSELNDKISKMDKNMQLVILDNKNTKEALNKMVEQNKQLMQLVTQLSDENKKVKSLVTDMATSAGGFYEQKIDTKIQEEYRKKQINEFEQVLTQKPSSKAKKANFADFT